MGIKSKNFRISEKIEVNWNTGVDENLEDYRLVTGIQNATEDAAVSVLDAGLKTDDLFPLMYGFQPISQENDKAIFPESLNDIGMVENLKRKIESKPRRAGSKGSRSPLRSEKWESK